MSPRRLIAMLALIRRFTVFTLLTMAATAAHAQDNLCRNGLFPTEAPFALAEIDGTGRAYFHDDTEDCPWAGGSDCRTRSYLVPGDTVIINRIGEGFACAFYPGKGGGTAGWISSNRLKLLRVENNPQLGAWIGTWSSEGNPELTLTPALGGIHAKGEAFWPGRPGTTDWPSIHVGEIDGPIRIVGHIGTYGDDNDCKVKFTLLGPFLIAGDNAQCGGANVSFSAVYQRQ